MNIPRVACVTCRSLPEPDPDEAPLLAALAEAGVEPSLVEWEDEVDWGAFDLCLPRSTWNYYLDRDAFLAWASRVAAVSRLYNPLAVIEDNTDKRYLARLASAGVPVVPTEFVSGDSIDGRPAPLAEILEDRGWTEVVIKPTVGAASHDSLRCGPGATADGEAHLARLARGGGAMVQPYLRSVEEPGERSVVWIDGALTHSVRKSPRFAGGHERVSETALPVPAEAAALADAALATVTEPLLYARVDVIPDATGRLVVMELELTEPSLFLAQSPPALERFARAIAREARRTPT